MWITNKRTKGKIRGVEMEHWRCCGVTKLDKMRREERKIKMVVTSNKMHRREYTDVVWCCKENKC